MTVERDIRTKKQIKSELNKLELLLEEAKVDRKKNDRPHMIMMLIGAFGMSFATTEMGGLYGVIVGFLSMVVFGYALSASIRLGDDSRTIIDKYGYEVTQLEDELYEIELSGGNEENEYDLDEAVREALSDSKSKDNETKTHYSKLDRSQEKLISDIIKKNKTKKDTTTFSPIAKQAPKSKDKTDDISDAKKTTVSTIKKATSKYSVTDLKKVVYSQFNGGWDTTSFDVEIDMQKFNICWTGIYSISEKKTRSRQMGKKWRLGKNQIRNVKTLKIQKHYEGHRHDAPIMSIEYYFYDGSSMKSDATIETIDIIQDLLDKKIKTRKQIISEGPSYLK